MAHRPSLASEVQVAPMFFRVCEALRYDELPRPLSRGFLRETSVAEWQRDETRQPGPPKQRSPHPLILSGLERTYEGLPFGPDLIEQWGAPHPRDRLGFDQTAARSTGTRAWVRSERPATAPEAGSGLDLGAAGKLPQTRFCAAADRRRRAVPRGHSATPTYGGERWGGTMQRPASDVVPPTVLTAVPNRYCERTAHAVEL